jgi:cytochrome c oxidase assembly protein subunit 15
MSVVLLVLVLIQYLLGSFIRHQGIGLHEHLGLGLLVLVAIAVNAGMAWRSGQRAIWKSASWLVVIAAVQVGLGLMSWILRYGLPQMGYVAVADSIQQVLVRTVHMVWGTVTLMAVVVNVLKIYRAAALPAGGATPAIQDHVAAVPAARGGQG